MAYLESKASSKACRTCKIEPCERVSLGLEQFIQAFSSIFRDIAVILEKEVPDCVHL